MLRNAYDRIPVPWVLENEQLVFVGSILLLIMGGIGFAGYLVVVDRKRGRGLIKILTASVLCAGLLGTGFLGLREQKDIEGTTVFKYNTEVNNMFAERAAEKYGVTFAERVTPETLETAKATVLKDGVQSKISIGFTKDGDLSLLDNDFTELEQR